MGTHPIFESDFDCLTDKLASRQTGTMSAQENVEHVEGVFIEPQLRGTPISRRTRGGSKIPILTPPKVAHRKDIETSESEAESEGTKPEEHGAGDIVSELVNEATKEEENESPIMSDADDEEDVDVADMSNKQLKERLTALGINTGPIVDSTRKLYERKLAKLLNRGKEAAHSTDEDAAPETGVPAETEVDAEKPKRPVRVKKASKKAEEQQQALDTYSDDDENNEEVQQVRKSRRIKAKKDTEVASDDEDVVGEGDNDEPVENGEDAPVETAEEVVGTVEDDQPAANTEDAATTVAESTADSVDTASKSRVNTLLFLFLMLVASYLVYSERETVLAKIELATSFVTDKYTSLYYSLLPEIETTTDEQVPPPSEEL